MRHRGLIVISVFFLTLIIQVKATRGERTVTDQLGRRITLPDDPVRVISLAPSITEIIFALNQGHRLKGVTQYSNYPPAARRLPRIGSYIHPDLERIVSLAPDLCIATKDGNPKAVVNRIASFNIPVFAVNPQNTEAVIETILEIGKLLNALEQAKILSAGMRSRIDKVKAIARKATDRPRVFFQIGISPIVSVGSQTFAHELIDLAGGKNLAEGNTAYPRYTQEQLISMAPDVFIISSMAGKEAVDRAKSEWETWTEVPAVRNKRLFFVDSDLFDRPTPRMVDALELLVRLIHPELFKENR